MNIEINFAIITCYKCGVQFAVASSYQHFLAQNHNSFWCPNGHQQAYPGESEAQKYERLYNAEAAKLLPLREKFEAEQRAHKRTKKKLKSVETRAAGGVCPCCNRTFHQLADHMKTKHQEYMILQGMTPQKQLTGEVQK